MRCGVGVLQCSPYLRGRLLSGCSLSFLTSAASSSSSCHIYHIAASSPSYSFLSLVFESETCSSPSSCPQLTSARLPGYPVKLPFQQPNHFPNHIITTNFSYNGPPHPQATWSPIYTGTKWTWNELSGMRCLIGTQLTSHRLTSVLPKSDVCHFPIEIE